MSGTLQATLSHFLYTCVFSPSLLSATLLPPLQVSSRPELADDPCKDPKYQEAAMDTMRAQKDEVTRAFSFDMVERI